MSDMMAAETPMNYHVVYFWRLLETEHVRILVDIRHEVGDDAPDGPIVYWDASSFSNDVAKALVADRASPAPARGEEIARALEPFARISVGVDEGAADSDEWYRHDGDYLLIGDFRRARKTLALLSAPTPPQPEGWQAEIARLIDPIGFTKLAQGREIGWPPIRLTAWENRTNDAMKIAEAILALFPTAAPNPAPQEGGDDRFRVALTQIASVEDEENEWDGRDRFRRVRDFAKRVVKEGVVPISLDDIARLPSHMKDAP